MRFVYVLEDDAKFQQEIVEAINFIDPKIQVRVFPKMKDMSAWIKLFMEKGPSVISQGGLVPHFVQYEPVNETETHQLSLIVTKVEYLGQRQLNLLKKTRDLFIRKGLCTKEDPTGFVITAFDRPEFKVRQLEDRILNNILLKPFDRLILVQHLTNAIDGRHPPSKNTIVNQKTTAVVEMLKDVPIEAFSEFGFVSRSERPIEVGSVSKYYGQLFITERHRSMFGTCQRCVPHPTLPGQFQLYFSFFGADPAQISNIRRKTKDKAEKAKIEWFSKPANPDQIVSFIILDPEEMGSGGAEGSIKRQFPTAQIHSYTDFKQFYTDLDPQSLKQSKDIVKPFAGAPEATFVFDPVSLHITNVESTVKDFKAVMSVLIKDIITKGTWLSNSLDTEGKEKLKSILRSGQIPKDRDNYFMLIANDASALIRYMGHEKRTDGKMGIRFAETTTDEQVAYFQKNSKLPKRIDAIIVSHRYLGENAKERWQNITQKIADRSGDANHKVKVFLTTSKEYSDAEERELATFLTDILFKPLDRLYFIHKMRWAFPNLVPKGDFSEGTTLKSDLVFKAANPVTIIEMSEAGFIMEYYREISIGAFREIVLWQPYEIGAPELMSNCNFVEEASGKKGTYHCQFVFFGMTDYFLKHIRIWIRDNYILSKEAS